jgi:hypothetical protein
MRTTLTLDEDVASKLRQLAHRRRQPFKVVVNAVLRRGLSAQDRQAASPRPFRVEVFSSPFRAGVDPMRLNQLADELEAEAFLRTAGSRSRRDPA